MVGRKEKHVPCCPRSGLLPIKGREQVHARRSKLETVGPEEKNLPCCPRSGLLPIKGREQVHARRSKLETALPDTIFEYANTVAEPSGGETEVWHAFPVGRQERGFILKIPDGICDASFSSSECADGCSGGIFMFKVKFGIYKYGLLVPISDISEDLATRDDLRGPWYTAPVICMILSRRPGLTPLIQLKRLILEKAKSDRPDNVYDRESITKQKNLNALALLYGARVHYPFGDGTKQGFLQEILEDKPAHGIYCVKVKADDGNSLQYDGSLHEVLYTLKSSIEEAETLLGSTDPVGLGSY
ncbi:hypothetical protein N7468_004176 [Penicillium chermesinum]|uniref:Uncharacterized protein n=1 Tax=Penicillium chermesinum TaxID=63820 RepID=A0A9W9TSI0_9EURO|nr:uncharacterized protein N7468_004176 [Penicillium chermesinum]KAJ5239557.1 hypothetical protein N7468_004176 [Penicillium chermesinum]KAJ6141193.1 hypothetical protein N7470_010089 [Penicillium chermesinum]